MNREMGDTRGMLEGEKIDAAEEVAEMNYDAKLAKYGLEKLQDQRMVDMSPEDISKVKLTAKSIVDEYLKTVRTNPNAGEDPEVRYKANQAWTFIDTAFSLDPSNPYYAQKNGALFILEEVKAIMRGTAPMTSTEQDAEAIRRSIWKSS